MPVTHHFACSCGEIQGYIYDAAEPMFRCYCHCRECRMFHSSPLYGVIYFKEDQVVISGNPTSYLQRGKLDGTHGSITAGGGRIDRKFCAHCGSRVINIIDFPASLIEGDPKEHKEGEEKSKLLTGVGVFYGNFPNWMNWNDIPEKFRPNCYFYASEAIVKTGCLFDSPKQLWVASDSPTEEQLAEKRAQKFEPKESYEFRCFCKQVTGKVKGTAKADRNLYCHCQECRNAHSAPLYSVMNFVEALGKDVEINGTTVAYERPLLVNGKQGFVKQVGGTLKRYFCPKCGVKVRNEIVIPTEVVKKVAAHSIPEGFDKDVLTYTGLFHGTFPDFTNENAIPETWRPAKHAFAKDMLFEDGTFHDGLPMQGGIAPDSGLGTNPNVDDEQKK